MPTLNAITADPTTITPGGTSLIAVDATADPDKTYRIVGEVVGTNQQAEVDVTLDNPPLTFTTDSATAGDGDVLVTAPDGGTLTPVVGQAGRFTFAP